VAEQDTATGAGAPAVVLGSAATTYASPEAPIHTTPGLMRRIAALIYEGLLLLALVLIASFPIAGLKGLTLDGIPHFFYQAYLFAVTAFYYAWQWQKTGQTLAMKTWRFRVMTESGKRLTWQRALIRYIWALVFYGPACVGILLFFFPSRLSPVITMWFFLPLMATILYARFDRDGQLLHDRLASTRLEDAPVPPKRKP
jgi:uncharacterized RDD family membrane protein YckC